MITTSSLWFSRADCLGDPFEGSTTQQSIVFDSEELGAKGYAIPPLVSQCEARKIWRKCLFVNCWHVSKYESAAMWKCYTRTNESIAIVSDFSRLLTCIEGEYCVGKVEYVNYVNGIIPSGNQFNYLLRKQQSYEHEKEVRAVFWDSKAMCEHMSARPSLDEVGTPVGYLSVRPETFRVI